MGRDVEFEDTFEGAELDRTKWVPYEDEPERSGEICVCEIFGRDVGRGEAKVGMGGEPPDPHAKEFVVDYVRGSRRS